MDKLVMGIFAHVDAGKTTLSEGILYCRGVRRTLGRVDHGDAFLDTHSLERERGITIFSKPALFSTARLSVTLVDTPGHVDFAAEAERVMPVLDCAILVISGVDGVQAHTVTLWQLLRRYHVPVFLFINKMDLPGKSREELLRQLQTQLSGGCIDFGQPDFLENVALCDEALLENYLSSGVITDANVRQLIAQRKVFPCCFGSALKLTGVDDLLQCLDTYAPVPEYGEAFAARVFKISRDAQGNRLTWLKITGGRLRVRDSLTYSTAGGETLEEKAVQLRLYSGEKYTVLEEAEPGTVCAVTGLSATYAGQGLGELAPAQRCALRPVMTYRVQLPPGCDAVTALPKLRQLEEEEPQLHVLFSDGQIHVQLMGKVQQEILRSLIRQRFSMDVELVDQRIYYLETISNTVEGVGHFEPLRHYAEVHLLLEPLPQGSGLVFSTVCPTDVLDAGYQNLVLTHLAEKQHRGVLTGAPITDMKVTLLVGKAHLKHTEGGDFRQATYRALRQGLMEAKSVLLEPWYRFELTVPTTQVGRAITDIRAMSGTFESPETQGSFSTLKGTVPAAEVKDYSQVLASYTQGMGRLQLSLSGYAPCHNAQQVIAAAGYDPEADLENTPDSVFCAHGGGYTVKWNQVKSCMHLESGLRQEQPPEPVLLTRNLRLDDKELEAIMEREFGPVKRPVYPSAERRPAAETMPIHPPRQRYLIVDGYNILFAWDELSALAQQDLDAARRKLIDTLTSYAGYRKCRVVLVFDGYKVKGNPGEKTTLHNIQVVYTKENQTGDQYIEALVEQIGKNYAVQVATSDALVQLSSLRSGVLRMSARELLSEVETAQKEMRRHYHTEHK